jgi:hypothetical protein
LLSVHAQRCTQRSQCPRQHFAFGVLGLADHRPFTLTRRYADAPAHTDGTSSNGAHAAEPVNLIMHEEDMKVTSA